MSAAPPPDGYLTRTGAAEMLGWYPQRLTHAIRRGDLQAYELDGRVLLREEDVQSLAEKLSGEPRPMNPDGL